MLTILQWAPCEIQREFGFPEFILSREADFNSEEIGSDWLAHGPHPMFTSMCS